MATMRKVTAAKWSWRGDAAWTDYDAKMNLHVESEYLEGVQRITIDGERLVDVSLTPKQIRVKWFCADCDDKNCIGLQRRFDDESKRRAVRREVEPFLKGLNVAILFSEDDAAYVEKMLLSHKATVRMDVTKRTKVVVLGDGVTVDDQKENIDVAIKEGIPVVTEAWLVKCITQNAILTAELDNFKVALPVAAAAVAVEEEEAAAPPAKKAKKAEPDNDDADHVLPAAPATNKMDVDTASSAPISAATVAVAAPAVPVGTKSKLRAPPKIVAPAHFMGVCSSDDSHIPYYLSVISIIGGAVEGTVRWPTLNNAMLKIKGSLLGDVFNYNEYEIIRGEEDVEIGTEYTAKIEGEAGELTLKGTWELASGDLSGTFSASPLTGDAIPGEAAGAVAGAAAAPAAVGGKANGTGPSDPAAARNAAALKFGLHFASGSSYKGKCLTESEFEMKVENRAGNVVEGTINWPSLKYTTKFQGEVDGVQLKFTETAVVNAGANAAPAPAFPLLYSGVMDENAQAIKGSRADLGNGATFSLNLTP